MANRYRPGASVTRAEAALREQEAKQPEAYSSEYGAQLEQLRSQLDARQPLNYQVNGDALYQQYRDRYTREGARAQRDAQGQAAGLTGGYGSSYAQAAGQQQYNAYLQQLADRVPELAQAAYDRDAARTKELYDRYALYDAAEQRDYGRYQDQLSRYDAELARLRSERDGARDFDYNAWADQRRFDLQTESSYYDRLAALITAYGYDPTESELAMAGMTRAQSDAMLRKNAQPAQTWYTAPVQTEKKEEKKEEQKKETTPRRVTL